MRMPQPAYALDHFRDRACLVPARACQQEAVTAALLREKHGGVGGAEQSILFDCMFGE
jgi:hypothetical protein